MQIAIIEICARYGNRRAASRRASSVQVLDWAAGRVEPSPVKVKASREKRSRNAHRRLNMFD